MARKSRRTNLVKPVETSVRVEQATEGLATGAYARLSVEKDDEGSIQTQITLIHNYIVEHPELRLTDKDPVHCRKRPFPIRKRFPGNGILYRDTASEVERSPDFHQ